MEVIRDWRVLKKLNGEWGLGCFIFEPFYDGPLRELRELLPNILEKRLPVTIDFKQGLDERAVKYIEMVKGAEKIYGADIPDPFIAKAPAEQAVKYLQALIDEYQNDLLGERETLIYLGYIPRDDQIGAAIVERRDGESIIEVVAGFGRTPREVSRGTPDVTLLLPERIVHIHKSSGLAYKLLRAVLSNSFHKKLPPWTQIELSFHRTGNIYLWAVHKIGGARAGI